MLFCVFNQWLLHEDHFANLILGNPEPTSGFVVIFSAPKPVLTSAVSIAFAFVVASSTPLPYVVIVTRKAGF